MNRLRGMAGQRGMTLIEILIVITILGLVMTLVGSRVIKQFGKAKIKTTQLAMHQLSQAITEYQLDHNKIPTVGDGLSSLEPEYMETVPNDGFGNPFHYEVPGQNGKPFDIISDGPDGTPGTEDDIRLSEVGK
ncbi:MAG: type II secretion system protein GspG [Deltaproteobacteria bacterium CG11_big_fil_rev_8_21_14_0_20_49_13]|nr:MAG: type II secretion system protein GspG [Deltaproteobacteria bacterium CG11_big_fil_rev_8_21_14_0_20_49_13]